MFDLVLPDKKFIVIQNGIPWSLGKDVIIQINDFKITDSSESAIKIKAYFSDVKVAWKIRSPPSCAPIALFEIYEFHGKPEGEGPSKLFTF
jgi:hypothetical protein